MKKVLMVNYWCMSIAWGLFMSDKMIISFIIATVMTIVLSTLGKRLNYWRLLTNVLISYIVMFGLYTNSNIMYFFPQLYKLLIIVCFNSAFANEILDKYKNKYILPFVLTLTLGLSILSFMIIVLPNDLFSIFTKRSLFIMASFIFLPYLINPLVCMASRRINIVNKKKHTILNKSY